MLSGPNLLAFIASGSALSALIGLQIFFFVIIVIIQKESLKLWCAIIVARQIGSALALVVLKDSKIFYPDDFVLLFDV